MHRVFPAPRVLALGLAALLTGACASYQPAPDMASLPQGREVRMQLSDAGSDQVGEYTAAGDRTQVEGALVRVGRDSVTVAIWRSDVVAGTARFEPGRVEVPLERGHILQMEEKRISPVRTAGLVVGIAAGVYLIFDQLFGGSTAGGLDPGGGPDITVLPRAILALWHGGA